MLFPVVVPGRRIGSSCRCSRGRKFLTKLPGWRGRRSARPGRCGSGFAMSWARGRRTGISPPCIRCGECRGSARRSWRVDWKYCLSMELADEGFEFTALNGVPGPAAGRRRRRSSGSGSSSTTGTGRRWSGGRNASTVSRRAETAWSPRMTLMPGIRRSTARAGPGTRATSPRPSATRPMTTQTPAGPRPRTWHDNLEASGLLPGEHAADSGYVSADLLVSCRLRSITLLGPPSRSRRWAGSFWRGTRRCRREAWSRERRGVSW